MKKLLILFVLLPLVYLVYQIMPVSVSGDEIRFAVALNEDKNTTLANLKEQGLIRNPSFFSLILYFLKVPADIEPGAYILQKNYWAPKVASILLYHPYQKWVILKPGLRKEQVSEILSDKFDWDIEKENEFNNTAQEGYLFPDTYLLNVDYSAEEFANRLISNFNDKFDAELQNDLLAQNIRNDTAVKIASLIERESGSLEDKALIAGIIWNRLDSDMRLQIDAVTQYILGKPGNWWPRVKPADHRIESPYNTYIHKGLPPGPIANPSLDSIRASVYPAETDCVFYIHDSDKNIHCSKTYEEHLENIEQYLK